MTSKIFPIYLVITEPDGGHTGQTAAKLTLKQSKELLKKEDVCVYIFKVFQKLSHNYMIKLPLSDYYSCLEINDYEDEVWDALSKENEKDFDEYIEIVYDNYEYNILYKEV